MPPAPPTTVRVDAVVPACDDVLVLELSDPAGGPLPGWEPGAHVDLALPGGLIRQYSLCGDPTDTGSWRVAVLLERGGRGGSRWVHETVVPGTVLGVGGPRNNFPLVAASEYVLVAGGIGITPLLPMAAELDRRGARWQLHYGGQRLSRMAFRAELAAYGSLVTWYPEESSGLIPVREVLDHGPSAPGAAVYCCGPEGLLTAVEELGAARPDVTVHLERFHAREAPPGPAAPEAPVTLHLARSGLTLKVPAGQSILTALERRGLPVPSSCREGTCASCETTVLAGEVEHRDSVLTDEERAAGATMMICVSRARSERLELDL